MRAAGPGNGRKSDPGPSISVVSYREDPELARSAVESVALAFEDDPSTTYFCRPDKRVEFYRGVLNSLLDSYPAERQVVCTVPPDAAAFVYVYPRLKEVGGWGRWLRGGLGPLLCVRPSRVAPGLAASDFFDAQRAAFLKDHGPFLYVSVMGTRPGAQGRGLGRALLRFVCDRADAAGLHCYIEATSVRSRALYERFGFEQIREWRENPQMPYTYILSRAPQPLGDAEATANDRLAEQQPLTSASAAEERAVASAAGTTANVASAAPAAETPAAGAVVPSGLPGGLAAAAAAGALSPSTLKAYIQRRRSKFSERRQLQQECRQAASATAAGGLDGLAAPYGLGVGPTVEQILIPYVELGVYDYWPLWNRPPSTAAAAGGAGAAAEDEGLAADVASAAVFAGLADTALSFRASAASASAAAVTSSAMVSPGEPWEAEPSAEFEAAAVTAAGPTSAAGKAAAAAAAAMGGPVWPVGGTSTSANAGASEPLAEASDVARGDESAASASGLREPLPDDLRAEGSDGGGGGSGGFGWPWGGGGGGGGLEWLGGLGGSNGGKSGEAAGRGDQGEVDADPGEGEASAGGGGGGWGWGWGSPSSGGGGGWLGGLGGGGDAGHDDGGGGGGGGWDAGGDDGGGDGGFD
ncbi:hypothetical protein HYH03_015008 [Edaphochlamys debaryana]|uniref:N-acetyltransferase domain-containing protein n=1 Tax=Edaphochlamys debaryana TaxID=47281 RepID=A0A835XUV8_9CHLO|nr:hypothetical protein HYH03_015008 [Edaphochlamys debaryana]|eukprot:KAG2486304.1 hypothetical protein HYH03_015008 [Edaphochlamys debaryana]